MAGRSPGQLPSPLHGHLKYQHVRDLDRGTVGFVQLAVDLTTGEQLAIKFVERATGPLLGRKAMGLSIGCCLQLTDDLEAEVQNHKRLIHPHIIQLKEVFLTPRYLALAMEYASGGTLYDLVARAPRGLPEPDARWYFQQLLLAVDYCHKQGVDDRDLKLENALLVNERQPLVKLCDFGYSKARLFELWLNLGDQPAPESKLGSPAYLAPEVVLAEGASTYCGRAADVWSCGVMLYLMLFGAYPFGRPEDVALRSSEERRSLLQRIVEVDYHLPGDKPVSEECRALLGRMLVGAPARRITVAGVMADPWFRRELPAGVLSLNDDLLAAQAAGREQQPAADQ